MLSNIISYLTGNPIKVKRKYVTVSNKLGDTILFVTGLDVLTGTNIGILAREDNEQTRYYLAVFGVLVVLLRKVIQKYIDLNTPSKSRNINQTNDTNIPN